MISLSSIPNLAPKALITPGGFLWWYLDIIDQEGNGLVLIWSFGLPFLPNYANSARKGIAPAPKSRPSLVLSIYQNFQQECYLFQEYEEADASWESNSWTFDRTSISSTSKTLNISLHMSIPNTDLVITGDIAVEGTSRSNGSRLHDTPHEWVPLLMPAKGQFHLQAGALKYTGTGRAYHDHNSSLVPLHDLNIERWWWGRIALPDREWIWYSLLPKDHSPRIDISISVTDAGETEIHDVAATDLQKLSKSIFGLSAPKSFHIETPWKERVLVNVCSTIDDGPFYQRYMITTNTTIGSGFGYAEQVVPDCVDNNWIRPLVQMRVANPQRNSFWLPLFCGPQKGRWGRLFGQIFR